MARSAYTDGYNPIQFTDFSLGLNLRDKSDTVDPREAIDLLNVTFNDRGAILQRDGTADLTPADLTNRVDSLAAFYKASGTRHLIAGCGTRLEAINTAGAVAASITGLSGGPYTFARFADPAHEYLYAANGIDTLRRWDGAAWSAPTATINAVAGAMPKPGSVCVTAAAPGVTSASNANNRLVATAFGTQLTAGPGGFATNPSRVFFSNAGQPEIWETDGDLTAKRGRNYIDLVPGDGEQIMAAVTWRELTFVFKESKFFVFWGESTNTDGYSPVFNYREVVNNVGLASRLAVNVGRDGVYFLNRRGVYRTTGSDPVLLSDKISPLWLGGLESYYQGQPINISQLDLARMCWHMEQLFVAVPTGSSTYCDRLLVYDTQHQWWTVYDIPMSAMAAFRRTDPTELHFGYATGPMRVGHRSFGSTDDRGQPITSRWRSGWLDYGSSQQKTIRETKIWGSGVLRTGLSVDFNRNQIAELDTRFSPAGSNWTYAELTGRGSSYTNLKVDFVTYTDLAANRPMTSIVDSALVRYATRGTLFSIQFANYPTVPNWAVHRVVRHLREIREPSVR